MNSLINYGEHYLNAYRTAQITRTVPSVKWQDERTSETERKKMKSVSRNENRMPLWCERRTFVHAQFPIESYYMWVARITYSADCSHFVVVVDWTSLFVYNCEWHWLIMLFDIKSYIQLFIFLVFVVPNYVRFVTRLHDVDVNYYFYWEFQSIIVMFRVQTWRLRFTIITITNLNRYIHEKKEAVERSMNRMRWCLPRHLPRTIIFILGLCILETKTGRLSFFPSP